MKANLCVLILLVAPVSALSAPFANGSFEQPAVPSGSTVLTNGASVGAWVVSVPAGNDVALIRDLHEGLAPLDGNQFLNFNGGDHTPGGSAVQDFDTAAGLTYEVSFAAGRLGSAPGTVGVKATIFADPAESSELTSVDAFALGAQGDWTPYMFRFTAAGPTTRIKFSDISTTTTSVDISLDAVQISVVPEPTGFSFALLLVMRVGVRTRSKARKPF